MSCSYVLFLGIGPCNSGVSAIGIQSFYLRILMRTAASFFLYWRYYFLRICFIMSLRKHSIPKRVHNWPVHLNRIIDIVAWPRPGRYPRKKPQFVQVGNKHVLKTIKKYRKRKRGNFGISLQKAEPRSPSRPVIMDIQVLPNVFLKN